MHEAPHPSRRRDLMPSGPCLDELQILIDPPEGGLVAADVLQVGIA